MPTRIIREGYLDSEAYAQVDDLARLVWHHMLAVADDFGCLSLAPSFLRRRLFFGGPSDATVSRVLDQLQTADLIRIYAHNDSRYAFIPRFGQRLNRATLKHPKPQFALYHDDEHACKLFSTIKDIASKSPVVVPDQSRSSPVVVPLMRCDEMGCDVKTPARKARLTEHPRFQEFWSDYPLKKARADALRAFSKLSPSDDLYAQIMHSLTKQKDSADWRKDGGKFIPHAATWINGRRWEDELTIDQPRKLAI